MKNPETNPISLFFKTITNNCSGLIAVMLVGTTCFLWLTHNPVPEELKNITLIIISFLFGRNVTLKSLKTKTNDNVPQE